MRMYICGIKLCDKCIAHINIRVKHTTLGPAYNEFGYNKLPATMSDIFSQKGILLIDINVLKVLLQ